MGYDQAKHYQLGTNEMILPNVFLLLAFSFMMQLPSAVQADQPPKSSEDSAIHVPTPTEVVTKMLEVANLTKGDVLYDLGCGDGRIVVAAASKYGCRAVGFEIDPRKVKESKENVERNQLQALVQIENKDIFTLDLSGASVITLFLLPEMNLKLIPQLEKLKDGSRVICHEFEIKGYQHDRKLTITTQRDGVPRDIYLYKLPLRRVTSEKLQ